jgi:hypothetical protein
VKPNKRDEEGNGPDTVERIRHALDPVAFFVFVGLRLARAIHEPQDYQKRVLRSNSKRILLVAGRQCGKTTTLAALALHTALFERGRLVLLVTPTERQARILFARVARMYGAYGGTVVEALSTRRMGLEFANDAQIEALPGNAAGIQGYDADLAIVDEAGFVSDELFDAITPSLAATNGRLVFAGRPNGQWGPFYDVWARGEGWEKHLIRADQSPLISSEHLAAEHARMTEREFAAQYLCSFEEAEGQLFRNDIIEAAFSNNVEPLWEDFDLLPAQRESELEEEPYLPATEDLYADLSDEELRRMRDEIELRIREKASLMTTEFEEALWEDFGR